MTSIARRSLRAEADLALRFARTYRMRMSELISAMNRSQSSGHDAESIRFCVEAVDLVLASHEQFAMSLTALTRFDDELPPLRAAA